MELEKNSLQMIKKIFQGLGDANSNDLAQHRITISVFFFLSGFIFSTFTSRIPGLQDRFSMNNAELGILLACLPAGLIISMPFAGIIINRYSIKNILSISSFLYIGLLVLLGFSTSIWQLYSILFLFGVTRTFFNISVNTISVVLQAKFEKKIINTFHGIWSFAALAGALLSLVLIGNNVDIQSHVLVVSLVCLFFTIIYYEHIPNMVSAKTKFKLIDSKQKGLIYLGCIAFGTMFCEGIMGDWSGLYFSKVGEVSNKYYVVGYTFYLTAMLIGRFFGDKLMAKYGESIIIKFSSFLLSTGFLISIIFTSPAVIVIGFLLVGFGVSCIIPITFLLSSKANDVPVSMAISTISLMGYVGFLLGPPLIGFISNALNLRWAFLTCFFFSILIGFFVNKYQNMAPG
jgi:MFS family permease